MLPQEHDPDSLVREEGKQGFEQRLAEAQPLSDYLFGHLAEKLDMDSTEGRAALFNHAQPLIGKLPEGVFREMMRARLAKLTGHAVRQAASRSRPGMQQPKTERTKPSTLRSIMALLIQNPEFFSLIDEPTRGLLANDEKAGPLARKIFTVLNENPGIRSGAIAEHFRGEAEYGQVWKLNTLEILLPTDNAQTEFLDTLRKYFTQKQESAKAERQAGLEKKAKAVGIAGLSEAEREEYIQLLSKSR
jgi:DNA primase